MTCGQDRTQSTSSTFSSEIIFHGDSLRVVDEVMCLSVCLPLHPCCRQLAWMKQLIYFIDPKHLPRAVVIRPSGLFTLNSAWTLSVSVRGPKADFLLIIRHLEEENTLIAMAIPCLEAGLPGVTATCQPPASASVSASASPEANRKKQICSLTVAPDEAGNPSATVGVILPDRHETDRLSPARLKQHVPSLCPQP